MHATFSYGKSRAARSIPLKHWRNRFLQKMVTENDHEMTGGRRRAGLHVNARLLCDGARSLVAVVSSLDDMGHVFQRAKVAVVQIPARWETCPTISVD